MTVADKNCATGASGLYINGVDFWANNPLIRVTNKDVTITFGMIFIR
jgi:hypothetical protein